MDVYNPFKKLSYLWTTHPPLMNIPDLTTSPDSAKSTEEKDHLERSTKKVKSDHTVLLPAEDITMESGSGYGEDGIPSASSVEDQEMENIEGLPDTQHPNQRSFKAALLEDNDGKREEIERRLLLLKPVIAKKTMKARKYQKRFPEFGLILQRKNSNEFANNIKVV